MPLSNFLLTLFYICIQGVVMDVSPLHFKKIEPSDCKLCKLILTNQYK